MDSTASTWLHIAEVRKFLSAVISNLLARADKHDASKLVDPEKEIFDTYTPLLRNSTYGSEEYNSFLAGMKPALDHHYKHNSHHPEFYAYDYFLGTINPEFVANGSAVRSMSLLDLIEMLCDWKAATLRHTDGDLLKSVEINQKRFGYSDELKSILLATIVELNLA